MCGMKSLRPQTVPAPIDVLLIEDDAVAITVMVDAVHARNLSTDVAGDLTEARRLLSRMQYKIVVIDITLPDGSGLEVLDYIRTTGQPMMHALVVTAADPATLAGLDRTQVKGIFFKPLNVDHFASYVQTLAEQP